VAASNKSGVRVQKSKEKTFLLFRSLSSRETQNNGQKQKQKREEESLLSLFFFTLRLSDVTHTLTHAR